MTSRDPEASLIKPYVDIWFYQDYQFFLTDLESDGHNLTPESKRLLTRTRLTNRKGTEAKG